ncbi:MAG: hypothetical protein JSU97_02730 [Dehalococcoidia bacterium]|nr:MAG: hypothetical protein JSU97_02730 [Dehalococcoidia bacterium]
MKRLALAILIVTVVAATVFAILNRPGAEATPPGATITVNSVQDNNIRDGELTLREAMMLATGDLLFTLLSEEECAQVSTIFWLEEPIHWCGGATGNPPGADYADTIEFASFGPVVLITLGSDLPPLDEGDDTIDASSSSTRWVVDGEDNWCFQIISNNNVVKGLEIYDCSEAVSIGDGAQNNTVGGSTQAERNVISGSGKGVAISGSGTNGNVVKGNYIGTDPSGTAAIPNDPYGVWIWGGAQNNTVGGSGPGEGNVISGNDGEGVHIGEGTKSNVVKGNYIGTNAAGDAALPNKYGVWISGGQNNTVGGSGLDEGNVISGNDGPGVFISGADTDGNAVKGNFIGTDASGAVAVANKTQGVLINDGAQNNTVGGSNPGEGNVISGNHFNVSMADSGTNGNVVKGNFIGTDASGTAAIFDPGLSIVGVIIGVGAQNNTVGGTAPGEGNVIAFNGDWGGVEVNAFAGTSTGNTIRGNSIHSNEGKGIWNIEGGNNELAPPTVDSAGSVFGTACPNCIVDIYSDDEDEGRVYEGSTTADGDGDWSFSGTPEGPNITATATDSDGNTSEFSDPLEPPWPAPSPSPAPSPTPSPTPTLTPTPGETRTLQWGPGWHNVTWSGTSTPEQAFACAAGNYAAAYRLVGGGWERYFPDRPDLSNMTDLGQYDAFLILVTGDVTCDMAVADPLGTERTLDWGVGWQNEGWTGADGTPPEDVFDCAEGSYAAAYRLVGGGWVRYFPDRPEISNMGPLDEYDAFLILVTAPVSCPMAVSP